MKACLLAVMVVTSGCADDSDLGLPCTPNEGCSDGYCAMDNLCTAPTELRTVTLTYSCMTAPANCGAWPRFSTTPSVGECSSHDCADAKFAPLACSGAPTGETQVLLVPIRFGTVQTMFDPAIHGAGSHQPQVVTTAQIVGDHADVAVHCEP